MRIVARRPKRYAPRGFPCAYFRTDRYDYYILKGEDPAVGNPLPFIFSPFQAAFPFPAKLRRHDLAIPPPPPAPRGGSRAIAADASHAARRPVGTTFGDSSLVFRRFRKPPQAMGETAGVLELNSRSAFASLGRPPAIGIRRRGRANLQATSRKCSHPGVSHESRRPVRP